MDYSDFAFSMGYKIVQNGSLAFSSHSGTQLYRVVQKTSSRLRELDTELGMSSRNLADNPVQTRKCRYIGTTHSMVYKGHREILTMHVP